MKRKALHSAKEWMQLITECRQSGLSDKDWCAANGINISTFYNAVTQLRRKAYQIPEREQEKGIVHDLTAKSLPDVVPVSIIPEDKTPCAVPALQEAAAHHDNSHMVQITTGNLSVQLCNGTDPALVGQILSFLVNQSC